MCGVLFVVSFALLCLCFADFGLLCDSLFVLLVCLRLIICLILVVVYFYSVLCVLVSSLYTWFPMFWVLVVVLVVCRLFLVLFVLVLLVDCEFYMCCALLVVCVFTCLRFVVEYDFVGFDV